MSLGAKLLVGALVLGAVGTAGTYAVTNGGFGIGGNGEGSNENTQTASNQNAPAPQAGASPSSDEAGRSSAGISLSPQQPSNPAPRSDGQGVNSNVPQETVQQAGSANTNTPSQQQDLNVQNSDSTSIENGSQIQSDPQKTLIQNTNGDNLQIKDQENTSLPGTKPEAEQPAGAENSQSLAQPNTAGGAQDKEGKTEHDTGSNA